MNLETFDDLLRTARSQREPQRLLFVFAAAELPADATPQQRAAFEAGHGGELAPLMCVDKTPDEVASFTALLEESRRAGPPWAIVFVAAMPGRDGIAPTAQDADAPLQRMVASVRAGTIAGLLSFDRQGRAVELG
ncbi:ribonucleotide reductase subunit alpha [uncultured Piscinibacter sp.]|uniref:ribonucleotide reductase subunit alpha n=1 Tax=uncultured Piscinibacter sp. TaxID=1131835 RepID=UPI002631335B|nr:ribonucleotide reductase subunit alpha [uncultured Piscinibacter sp.]